MFIFNLKEKLFFLTDDLIDIYSSIYYLFSCLNFISQPFPKSSASVSLGRLMFLFIGENLNEDF